MGEKQWCLFTRKLFSKKLKKSFRVDGKMCFPSNKGEEIGRGMLRKIIKDAELTREEFLELVKKYK